MKNPGKGDYEKFRESTDRLEYERRLKKKIQDKEGKKQFKEELKRLKEIGDSEALITAISDAMRQGICNMDDLFAIGIDVKKKEGGKVWNIADSLREKFKNSVNDLNIDGLFVDQQKELIEPGIDNVLDETIVPADFSEQNINGGSGEYIPPALISREKYLLEVLTDLEIKGDLLERWQGQNSSNMIRRESYSLWIIKELDMMVLVCDEEGNRTFVIDGISSPYDYIRKTKSELKEMANVKSFVWTDVDSWKKQLEELLIIFDDVEVSEGSTNERASFVDEDLPVANVNDEIFDEAGNRYLSIGTLYILDEVDGGYRKIEKIIKKYNIEGIRGKSNRGRILNFYPIEEVKRHTNANEDLPIANENNEIIIDGNRYLTKGTLSNLDEINRHFNTIEKIIEKYNIQGIRGKDRGKRVRNFYPIEEIKKYMNVNENLPIANEDNEVVDEYGNRYLTIKALGRSDEIDANPIKIGKIIGENNIQGIKGKSKDNRIYNFYSIEEVKKYTNDNKDLPVANEDNEIVDEYGNRYLTIKALGRLDEIDAGRDKIRKLIEANNIQSVKAKSNRGRIRDFYPIEEIRKYINV